MEKLIKKEKEWRWKKSDKCGNEKRKPTKREIKNRKNNDKR